ncbi:MAG TPA: hypothetical protein VF346_02230 [Bacteroidales bacterium]
MRNNIAIDKLENIDNQRINSLVNLGTGSVDSVKNSSGLEILTAENCENFASYIEHLGIDKDPDIVVLPSLHHYYYDAEEMSNVKTMINLKELNQIKQIKDFLHSIFHILPPNCNFIGCFVDNKKQNGFVLSNGPSDFHYKRNSDAIENGIASSSPFLSMIYSMIDSKTNKYMSERSVTLLLEENGFNVLNMTEINGLTYFLAQKTRAINE